MLTDVLRREGFTDNHKRIWRIYAEEGLQVKRRRRGRKRYVATVRVKEEPRRPDDRWGMDFVHDSLVDGRKFRSLTFIEHCTRESPQLEPRLSIGGVGVVAVLEEIKECGRRPREPQVDNGPEFRSRALVSWCHANDVLIRFITPGKPMQNGHIESFSATFRNECLNEHWFTDLKDAKEKIETWRRMYNSFRPHSSLGGATPEERLKELSSNLSVQEWVVQ